MLLSQCYRLGPSLYRAGSAALLGRRCCHSYVHTHSSFAISLVLKLFSEYPYLLFEFTPQNIVIQVGVFLVCLSNSPHPIVQPFERPGSVGSVTGIAIIRLSMSCANISDARWYWTKWMPLTLHAFKTSLHDAF